MLPLEFWEEVYPSSARQLSELRDERDEIKGLLRELETSLDHETAAHAKLFLHRQTVANNRPEAGRASFSDCGRLYGGQAGSRAALVAGGSPGTIVQFTIIWAAMSGRPDPLSSTRSLGLWSACLISLALFRG
jgi:hypothetical protein